MKIYNINSSNHFLTRLGLIAVIYCILFLFGFIIDLNSEGGCLGPIYLLLPILIGIPLTSIVLLIDLSIIWYKGDFTIEKFLINFMLFSPYIIIILMRL